MAEPEAPPEPLYSVVRNDEDQYSIWPADRQVPDGWQVMAVTGTKEQCLDHIRSTWTDMRPLSLRQRLDQQRLDQPSTAR